MEHSVLYGILSVIGAAKRDNVHTHTLDRHAVIEGSLPRMTTLYEYYPTVCQPSPRACSDRPVLFNRVLLRRRLSATERFETWAHTLS